MANAESYYSLPSNLWDVGFGKPTYGMLKKKSPTTLAVGDKIYFFKIILLHLITRQTIILIAHRRSRIIKPNRTLTRRRRRYIRKPLRTTSKESIEAHRQTIPKHFQDTWVLVFLFVLHLNATSSSINFYRDDTDKSKNHTKANQPRE